MVVAVMMNVEPQTQRDKNPTGLSVARLVS
jgi:hypothetical protein